MTDLLIQRRQRAGVDIFLSCASSGRSIHISDNIVMAGSGEIGITNGVNGGAVPIAFDINRSPGIALLGPALMNK